MAAPPLLLELLLWGALLAPSAARPPAAKASAAPTGVEVRVGGVLPEDSRRFPWAWPRVAPALSLAREALRLDGLAVRTAFASSDKNGGCHEEVSVFKAADLRGSHDPDVLLGLGCMGSRSLLPSFARYWRLPLLLAGPYWSLDAVPETVYAGPLGRSLPAFQRRLFEHFHWTGRPVFALSHDKDSWRYYYDGLWRTGGYHQDLGRTGVTVFPLAQEPGQAGGPIHLVGRVVFICMSLEELHQMIYLAHAQNMTNGDYVFFYLDLFGESLRAVGHREAAKPWQSNVNDTGGLREAFQTVLVITPHEPQTPEYHRFEKELVLRAQRDFGVAINDSLGHLVAGCFHDGLLLYLRALNETLCEGGTKQNTSCILEKMRSLKFQGVTGMVSINRNNEREMDFDLWAMRDVETGEFQVVGHYIALEKRINWTGDILWKKGAPPLDNPSCVFNKDDPSCAAFLNECFPINCFPRRTNLVTHLSSDKDTGKIQICQWSMDGKDKLVNLGSTFF